MDLGRVLTQRWPSRRMWSPLPSPTVARPVCARVAMGAPDEPCHRCSKLFTGICAGRAKPARRGHLGGGAERCTACARGREFREHDDPVIKAER
eukprot:6331458-Pyramimonas_sp.AAC.2